jgi:hypothetical protein
MHFSTIIVTTLGFVAQAVVATPTDVSQWTNTETVEKFKTFRVALGLPAIPDTSAVRGRALLNERDCVTDCYDFWCSNVPLDQAFFWYATPVVWCWETFTD